MYIVCTSVFAGVHCVLTADISILMSTVASWYVEVITTMLLLWLSLYQFITQQLPIDHIQVVSLCGG